MNKIYIFYALLMIAALPLSKLSAFTFEDCMALDMKCVEKFKSPESIFSKEVESIGVKAAFENDEKLYVEFSEGYRYEENAQCRIVVGGAAGEPLSVLDYSMGSSKRECRYSSDEISKVLHQNDYLRCGKDTVNGKLIRWVATFYKRYKKWRPLRLYTCRDGVSIKKRKCWIETKKMISPYHEYQPVMKRDVTKDECIEHAKADVDCKKAPPEVHSFGVIWGGKEDRASYSFRCASQENKKRFIKDDYYVEMKDKKGLFSLLAVNDFSCDDKARRFSCYNINSKRDINVTGKYKDGTGDLVGFRVSYRTKVSKYSLEKNQLYQLIRKIINGKYISFGDKFVSEFKKYNIEKSGFKKFELDEYLIGYRNNGFNTTLYLTLPDHIRTEVQHRKARKKRSGKVTSSGTKKFQESMALSLQNGKVNSHGKTIVTKTSVVGGKKITTVTDPISSYLYYQNHKLFLVYDEPNHARPIIELSNVYANNMRPQQMRWVKKYDSEEYIREDESILSLKDRNVVYEKKIKWRDVDKNSYLGEVTRTIKFEGIYKPSLVGKIGNGLPANGSLQNVSNQRKCLNLKRKGRGKTTYFGFDLASCDSKIMNLGSNTIEASRFNDFKGTKIFCRGCTIKLSSFSNGDFRDVDFSGVNFENVNFNRADLRGANFENSTFTNVDFRDAKLAKTSFVGATVVRGNFQSANMTGANLHGARFVESNVQNADLNYVHTTNVDIVNKTAKQALRDYIVGKTFPVCGNNKSIPIFSFEKKMVEDINLVNCYSYLGAKYKLEDQKISFFEVINIDDEWIELRSSFSYDKSSALDRLTKKSFFIRSDDFHTPYSITDGNMTLPASFLQPSVRPRKEWKQKLNVPKIFGSKSICCNASHAVRVERFFYPPVGFDVDKMRIISNGKTIDPAKCPNLC